MNAVWSVSFGLGATLSCAALLFLCGLVVLPKRWDPALRPHAFPLVGAALYVVSCWIAVSAWEIPLDVAIPVFAASVVGCSLIRARRVSAAIVGAASRTVLRDVGAFVVFYVVAFLLASPRVDAAMMVPARPGADDFMTHARIARQLLFYGTPSIDAGSFDVRESPTVSFLLALLAVPFARDPISAALPLELALVALTGFVAASFCRSIFKLTTLTAAVIGLITVSSPYVMRLVDTFALAALVGGSLLILLVWTTARTSSGRIWDPPLVVASLSAYVLLLFTAAFSLPAAVTAQGLVAAVRAAQGKSAAGMLISVATSLAVIVLAFGDRIQFATTDAARSGLLPMSYLALSAVVLSSVVQVGQRESLVRKVVADPTDFRLAMALTPYLAIALLIGCASAAMAREARAARMPQSWRGISKLAPLGFRELTLKVDHDPDRLLPSATRYWLPNRRIHVVEPEVRLRDLPFESVSRQNPMLIQNFGCQGVGHADAIAIEGLGCAIYAPPGLEIDSRYPFNRTFLSISFAGMTDREAGGRWNVGRNMALRILSDPERAGLADQRYLNVFVHAFLTPDAPSVRLAVEWGTTHRTGETAVSGQDSFSVPVVSGDWTGNRVWALPVTILFPGGGNVLFHELSITAQPLGRPVQ